MAETGTAGDAHGDKGDMEIGAHVSTYGSVINLLYYGAGAVFVIALFVIWLIA